MSLAFLLEGGIMIDGLKLIIQYPVVDIHGNYWDAFAYREEAAKFRIMEALALLERE